MIVSSVLPSFIQYSPVNDSAYFALNSTVLSVSQVGSYPINITAMLGNLKLTIPSTLILTCAQSKFIIVPQLKSSYTYVIGSPATIIQAGIFGCTNPECQDSIALSINITPLLSTDILSFDPTFGIVKVMATDPIYSGTYRATVKA